MANKISVKFRCPQPADCYPETQKNCLYCPFEGKCANGIITVLAEPTKPLMLGIDMDDVIKCLYPSKQFFNDGFLGIECFGCDSLSEIQKAFEQNIRNLFSNEKEVTG